VGVLLSFKFREAVKKEYNLGDVDANVVEAKIGALVDPKKGTPADLTKLATLMEGVLKETFSNTQRAKKELSQAVDAYRYFQPVWDSANPPPKIGLDALTFTPDFGGFNTNSLTPDNVPVFKPDPEKGASAIDWEKEMHAAYQAQPDLQNNKAARDSHKLYEAWRAEQYENYASGKGFRPKAIDYTKK
jgi:hypothetical protein